MTTPPADALATRIEALAEGVLEEFGAHIYDLEVRGGGGGLVRLLVDKEEGGITISDVTRIAKQLGYLLDAEDVVPFAYRFEVSSPGVERPIRDARTARANVGERVRLTLGVDVPGVGRVLEGTLDSVQGETLTVRRANGDAHSVFASDVRKGRTLFDFDGNKQPKK